MACENPRKFELELYGYIKDKKMIGDFHIFIGSQD
jgi:hypothetical protein